MHVVSVNHPMLRCQLRINSMALHQCACVWSRVHLRSRHVEAWLLLCFNHYLQHTGCHSHRATCSHCFLMVLIVLFAQYNAGTCATCLFVKLLFARSYVCWLLGYVPMPLMSQAAKKRTVDELIEEPHQHRLLL